MLANNIFHITPLKTVQNFLKKCVQCERRKMNRRQDKKNMIKKTNKVTDLQGIPLFFPSDVLKVFPLKIIKKKKLEENYTDIDF